MQLSLLQLWFTHSFFIHPLIPPTFEKWVGTSSFVLQNFHFSTAKLRKIAYKFQIFVLQRFIFSPAIVLQRTTHLFNPSQTTLKTHFLKVGQSVTREANLAHPVIVGFPRDLASGRWWVDPLSKWLSC